MKVIVTAAVCMALSSPVHASAKGKDDAELRARATVEKLDREQMILLTQGSVAIPIPGVKMPEGAVLGAGFVQGISAAGIPNLTEANASLGVGWIVGEEGTAATALPSGTSIAASWNPDLARRGGRMIGGEAKALGYNVLLAGGVNLVRDPRGGRSFEYLSEDPLLSGVMAGASIDGVQSNGIMATIKHFALNDQETARRIANVTISDAAARESDLLAFEIGIEHGRPASVMCSYNKVNGDYACGSDYLLNRVLKKDWGFKGWVMSDWGATNDLKWALAGLDHQSGKEIDTSVYFGQQLADAAARDPAYDERLKDMATRIVRSMYRLNVTTLTADPSTIDFESNAQVSQKAAEEGIVLLSNRNNALPLLANAGRIAVIGGRADLGVMAGGGSSQVQGRGGPAFSIPYKGGTPLSKVFPFAYHPSVPLDAITRRAVGSQVIFRDGEYISESVAAARSADVVIVFATQWMNEGFDVPDIGLPGNQDALIEAVARANPRTIVVLETGGAVTMPWLDRTAAVLAAWYPGARGAEAIASVLFGDVTPSGRLPVTFPTSVDQLPRQKIAGFDTLEPDFDGRANGMQVNIDYDVEGADVGYRWFARTNRKPLFPFGYGLSYTSFAHDDFKVRRSGGRLIATATVRNTGKRAGSDVVQVYALDSAGLGSVRLAGFAKVALRPGESSKVEVELEPRTFSSWSGDHWETAAGAHRFALGRDAQTFDAVVTVKLPGAAPKP